MQRAGRIQLNRKRIKNEVMNMRDNLDKTLNYNIFVGANRYKTDAFLRFKEPQSYYKYGKFMRRRHKHLINFSSICHLMMIFYYLFQLETGLIKYLLISLMVAIFTFTYVLKYQTMKHKQYLLLMQTVILTFIIPNNEKEPEEDDPRVYFGSMVYMLAFGMSWIQYISFSTLLNLLRFLVKGFPLYFLTYTQLPYLSIFCVLFGFVERYLKEYWVMVDSHK